MMSYYQRKSKLPKQYSPVELPTEIDFFELLKFNRKVLIKLGCVTQEQRKKWYQNFLKKPQVNMTKISNEEYLMVYHYLKTIDKL